jgi:putative transposase
VLQRGVLRPGVRKLKRLRREAGRLDSLCARRGGVYCERARAVKSRLYRLLREWARETAKFTVKLALQYKAAIVVDVPDGGSVRELKQSEKYPAGRRALLDFGKLRRLVKAPAEWHGVPYIETRLYSTICPRCETKMMELPGRRVKCPSCGLEAGRDEVPIMWAIKRFDKLLKAAKSQPLAFLSPAMFISPAVLASP